jgi:hypothetical protein
MWWVVVALAVIVAFVAYTVLVNMRPRRCPSCKRINVFRRTKTGRRREERDNESDLRRQLTEYMCGCCGTRYWIIWDDFEGCRASMSAPVTTEPESGAGPDRPGS